MLASKDENTGDRGGRGGGRGGVEGIGGVAVGDGKVDRRQRDDEMTASSGHSIG
jgi:hypothetical protein